MKRAITYHLCTGTLRNCLVWIDCRQFKGGQELSDNGLGFNDGGKSWVNAAVWERVGFATAYHSRCRMEFGQLK